MQNSARVGSPLRVQMLRSFAVALVPIFVLLFVAVETLMVPSVRKQITNELSNTTYLLSNTIKASSDAAIRNHLKNIAEKNRELANQYLALINRDVITRKEGLKRLREIILSQKVGTSGYVYCVSSTGIPKIHPNPIVEANDSAQHDFIREQMRMKEGYLEYSWQMPDDKEAKAKALYMVYFQPFDWIISASSYRSEFSELLNPEDFREAVNSIKFGKSGYAYIIDTVGTTVIHPTLKDFNIFLQNDIAPDFTKRMITEKSGIIEYKWKSGQKNIDKIAAFHTIPDLGWIVVSAAYSKEVFRPITVTRAVAYSAMLLLIIISIVAAYSISKKFVLPIERMMVHMDTIAKLGLQQPMTVEKDDELGRLAYEINRYLEVVDQQKQHIQIERARYWSLFDTSPDAIILLKGNTIIDCNTSTLRMFEGTKDQIVGKSVIDFSSQTQAGNLDADELSLRYVKTCLEGDVQTFEWEHITLNKRKFLAEVRLTYFKGIEGQPTVVAFVRDISIKKKDEEEIRKQAAFISTLLNAIPIPVFYKDNQGIYQGCNKAYSDFSGYSNNEIVGKTTYDIWPVDIAKIHHKKDIQLLKAPQHIEYESKFRRKDGELKDVFVVKDIYVNAVGEPQGLIAAFIDITEQKNTALQLENYKNHLELMVNERTEELEAANEELSATVEELQNTLSKLKEAQNQLIYSEKMVSLGVLAAGVAHELNNPLNFIYGGVMGLKKYVETNLAEHSAALSSIIYAINEGAQRAAKIVASLNHYTRSEDLPNVPCDIHSIINNCLVMLSNEIGSTIEITKVFTAAKSTLWGNEGKLHQAFLNVIQNAIQAINQYGYIRMATVNQGDFIIISFTDNGCGIAEHDIIRVTDPFFTTKEVGKGTGLGLSVTNNIIIEHKGSLVINSKQGKGTTVIIKLPLNNTTNEQ
jgi:PAS domain S-box-containing protein